MPAMMMMLQWTRMMLAPQILWRLHHPFLLSHGKSHSFSFGVPLGVGSSTIGEQRWQFFDGSERKGNSIAVGSE
jgi:hypothetical protein